MTTLVSCILGRKITTSLSDQIIRESQALESNPTVYAVINVYDKSEKLEQTFKAKSKLEYWRILGWILGYPSEVTESYIKEKLSTNTSKSLREYALSVGEMGTSSLSVVTKIEGEIIIE